MTKSNAVLGWVVALAVGAGCIDGVETSTDESELGGWIPTYVDGQYDAVGIVRFGGSFCTGTLIAETYVLTGAHCLPATPFPGTFQLKTVPLSGGGIGNVTYNVTGTYAHPDYEVGTYGQNDIGVLEIEPATKVTANVPPLPLATVVPSLGSSITLVGYGQAGAPINGGPLCLITEGDKRAGATEVTDLDDGGSGDLTYFYDMHGGAIHGCSGDSGGPALAGPDGPIVGVNTAMDAGKAVAVYLPWLQRQLVSPGNHIAAFDVSAGGPAGDSLYLDNRPDSQLGWLDPGDVQLAGDFMDTGTDQILYLNRGGTGGQIRIASYADLVAPSENLYWHNWIGAPSAFAEFVQANDRLYVGDFRNAGHDQLLMLNQSGGGTQPQLRVMNFSAGYAQTWYSSTYANEPLVGWHDIADSLVVGDFRNLGYDQVMLINRAGTDGRIAILDLSDGQYPGEWVYFEHHLDGVQLNGWTDAGDLAIAGDFRGLGYDQVLFVNRGGGNGRFLVADFSDGVFPAEWQYYEAYGWSTFLDGFHDSTVDVQLAGDFRGLGFDQVVFVNRDLPAFSRAIVVDFYDGVSSTNPGFVQTSALASPLLTRIDPADKIIAGNITGGSLDRLVTIEP